jgi:hypothetical protein
MEAVDRAQLCLRGWHSTVVYACMQSQQYEAYDVILCLLCFFKCLVDVPSAWALKQLYC